MAEHLPVISGTWPDGTGKRGNFIDAAQSGVANSPVARYDFDTFKYKSPDNQEKDIDIRTGSISGVLTTISERTSAPDIGSSYNPDDAAPEFNEPSPVDPQQPPEEEPPEENGPSPPSEDWLDEMKTVNIMSSSIIRTNWSAPYVNGTEQYQKDFIASGNFYPSQNLSWVLQ